ncbi:MAG: class I SAM-dependent methyltransferase [Patescibacteria group bacterium]
MQEKIKAALEHEKRTWNKIFSEELARESTEKFSSYWWRYYYEQIRDCVNSISIPANASILEAGCGSGKATLLSLSNKNITLLDISTEGLRLAEKLATIHGCKKVSYVEGNMFSMPFPDNNFDLTWNIGTIEHYDKELVIQILKEMLRVTKIGGHIGIAIPNFNSLPIKKAELLARPRFKKILKHIPGYRLDTEKIYGPKDIEDMLSSAAKQLGSGLHTAKVYNLGSPLFVETPKIFIQIFTIFFERFFTKRKFLFLVISQKK